MAAVIEDDFVCCVVDTLTLWPQDTHTSASAALDCSNVTGKVPRLANLLFPKAVLYPAHVFPPYKATKYRLDIKPPLLNGTSAQNIPKAQLPQKQAALLGKLVVSENPLDSSTV